MPPLWAALQELRTRSERPLHVIFVDDGSDDGTGESLAEHIAGDPDGPWTLLRHPHNAGLTAALRTGSEAARTPLIGWLDADLTYDPAVLEPLAALVEAGADLAQASCHHPGGHIAGVPAWRAWLSRRASAVHRLATRSRLHTFTCMVRVQRAELLHRTWPRRGGFVGVTEQLLRSLAAGARVAEHPATLHRRRAGSSKLQVGRAARGHLALAWAAWRRHLGTRL